MQIIDNIHISIYVYIHKVTKAYAYITWITIVI